MGKNPRCLFEDKIESFLNKEKESTFGILCEGYHTIADVQWLPADITILDKIKKKL